MWLSQSAVVYSGRQCAPVVNAADATGQKQLAEGTDFSVIVPTGRVNVGKYDYVITGKGNYAGTVTKSLLILPAPPAGVSAKASGNKAVTVKWEPVPGATQYNIYRYNSAKKDYVYKGTSYSASYADTTVSAGVTYYYKLVAVTKTESLTLVSDRSAAASATAK